MYQYCLHLGASDCKYSLQPTEREREREGLYYNINDVELPLSHSDAYTGVNRDYSIEE